MAKALQAVRGMNDILPDESGFWTLVEDLLRQVARGYGYRELRTPLLECTELFARSIGEVTDIVEKEMYTFADRNQDSLTLRPEGTASCVRAGIEHGLLYNQIQRLFYLGPMFRHERPQKGRYRQFHQFGVEVFGLAGPDIDAEILLMSARFWEALKIKNLVELQINTLGTDATRRNYREKLVNYFTDNFANLDEDSRRRLHTNPLRILDSKNPDLQELIGAAPQITDCLDSASAAHFARLTKILDAVGLAYRVNPRLVRGLDYYGLTVFEWVTTELGAQNAICGGGHYDNLVAEMGGKATPAIGFAIGLERLITLVKMHNSVPTKPTVYLVLLGEAVIADGLQLAEAVHRELPEIIVITNSGGGNIGTQLKRADKCGATLALILGEEELAARAVTVKFLRKDVPQEQVRWENLVKSLAHQL